MTGEEKGGMWDELSLVQDWLGGGRKRERTKPDFNALGGARSGAGLPGRSGGAEPGPGRGQEMPRAAGPAVPVRLPDEEAAAFLGRLSKGVAACEACRLASGRKKTVFGMGSQAPSVLIVGEGPGAEEDSSGLPFVGPAGKLLDRMLGSIGLFREDNAYIANVVKCRPPGNRDPAPDEVEACLSWLEAQVDLLAPRAILCLGRSAMRALTGSQEGITHMRGRWLEYRGIPLIATFHPSALLRDESLKRPAWEDLKALREGLDNVRLS